MWWLQAVNKACCSVDHGGSASQDVKIMVGYIPFMASLIQLLLGLELLFGKLKAISCKRLRLFKRNFIQKLEGREEGSKKRK
ncbi:Leucine-Rich Repeat-Containing Protein 31 [Manis pentadactyla]|nr:Leucine-Rich Repeat-Containing Protein 31 [Manis pentadactyla]